MEAEYACNLNNRFEVFLDEENDPLDLLAKQEQAHRKAGDKKDGAKKDAGKKKGLSKTLVESVKTIAAAVDSNHPPMKPLGRRNDGAPPASAGGGPRSEGGQRPPRRNDNPNMERRNNERNFEPRPEGDRPPREHRGGGARGDGPRGPRFPREGGREGGPRPPRGGQREFDRRSGDVRSGVKSVEKRGGQGAYNWGSATDTSPNEQGDVEQQQPQQGANSGNLNPDNSHEENPEAGGEDAAPAGPEVVEMTLEQWKKEQAAKKSKAEYSANIRKPNEGEKDDPKLKKATIIRKKKEEETYDSENDAEESEDECEKMKKQLEQTLASQFHFADQRGGPPRGGRGPGRTGPGGPRGQPSHGGPGGAPGGSHPNPKPGPGARSNRNQHTPRVEDLNDFPTLAA